MYRTIFLFYLHEYLKGAREAIDSKGFRKKKQQNNLPSSEKNLVA